MAAGLPQDLQRGVESGEVIPYFQPLVELRTGQLSGFEVLARWRHPTRGMVLPDQFIWLAEETGLIGKLTEGLLQQAFEAVAELPERLTLAVNISAIQLRNPGLPGQIGAVAKKTGFSLSRLTVEITESALMSNSEQARLITEELKIRGVRLALDDFGTGYSSLRYLHALTFDQIKVDRSFVQSIISRRDSRKIVAAILGLGQSLGMVTVAEGVEDLAQAEMLMKLGCNLGQGWLYGQPVAARELPHIVQANQMMELRQVPVALASADLSFHLDSLPMQRLSQLQAIYDGAPVGLCFLDTNLRYVSLNRRLAEINDLPIIVHLGQTVKEVLPGIFPQLEPYLTRALAGEPIKGLEIEYVNAYGVKKRILISYQPARDEAGEAAGIAVSVADVTNRSNTEQALRESEEHYRHRVELSPQVSWTADSTGHITDASPLWSSLTGLSLAQTVDQGWLNALHPDDVETTIVAWKQAVVSGDPVDLQYRILCKNGTFRWMRARALPRRGEDGEIIRWYGMLEDIDELMRTMEELRESRARLRALSKTAQ